MLRLLPMLLVVLVTLAGWLAPAGGGAVRGAATSAAPRAAVGDAEPAVAPDARFPVGGPSAAAAWEVATRHWGTVPCGGEVELSWTRLAAGVNGTASWWNPTDAWSNPGENYDCRVELNVEMDFDWAKLCTVLAHEAGHLLGRQHVSGDPLMDPTYSRPLPACDEAADPAAPAPADGEPEAELEEAGVTVTAVSGPPAARPRWTGPGGRSAKAAAAGARCLSGRAATRRVRRFACVRGTGGVRRGWRAR